MDHNKLLQRTDAPPLSLELLEEHVPTVKAGKAAQDELNEILKDPENTLTKKERFAYLKKIRAGQKAQEILIISASPLIKDLASKELSRRKAWSTRVSYLDIIQEAMYGFIRGLHAYNPMKTKSSATNYLGQWIMAQVRRRLEVLEHDFAIPYEVMERNRRIIAVTGRLTNELERPPTDEEVLEALNDGKYQSNNKWGRVNDGTEVKKANQFTQKHLDIAKDMQPKLYAMQSNEPSTSEDEGTYERSSTSISTTQPRNIEELESQSIRESQHHFFIQVFENMRIGSKQKDVITRYFGIKPYEESQTYKNIVTNTGLPVRFVKNVIMSFQQYMAVKGGIFHYTLAQIPEEDIADLEFEWLLPILGDYPQGTPPTPPPTTLTVLK